MTVFAKMYLTILNEINVEMDKIRIRIVLFLNIWKKGC